MAGVAKPSVANIGREASYTVIGVSGSQGSGGTVSSCGLFDGTTPDAYSVASVMYWETAGNYVEIDITSTKVNIWRSGTTSWPSYTRTLTIKKWNGSAYDDVTSMYPQTATSATTNGKWEKTISNLPKGRYRFERDPNATNATYRIDSEWYIENVANNKFLISSNGEYQSIRNRTVDTSKEMARCGVAWWKMEEASGNLIDSKGANTGTVTGTSVISGINGKARSFNGSDYINFSSQVIPIGKKSIRLRFRKSSLPSATMCILNNAFTNALPTANGILMIINTTGNLSISYYFGSQSSVFSITTTINVCDGNWHDILYTWDGTTNTNAVKIYIDNFENPHVQGTYTSVEVNNSTALLTIGRTSNTTYVYPLIGDLDEIEIYNDVVAFRFDNLLSVGVGGTEQDFLKYGLEKLDQIDLSSPLSTRGFVEKNTTTVGSGRVFKRSFDTSKIAIKKATIT